MPDLHYHVDAALLPAEGGNGHLAPVRMCVIDVGTNSFHAIIVDVFSNGTFSTIDKIKEMVKLGEKGLSAHQLTESAMRRGVEALRRIRMLAEGWGATEFLAFATSAVREATNGGDFIERAWREVRMRVQVISGAREALLIYKAVRHTVDLQAPTLVVDIGGGSTEFIVGTHDAPLFLTSLKIGAARMSERFITTDPVGQAEFQALRQHYREQLQPVFEAARAHGVRKVVGSSGTLENLALAFSTYYGNHGAPIFQQAFDGQAFRLLTKRVMRSTRAERLEMEGIDRKRVDQVVAGAILVDVILKDLGIESIRISPSALREGMVIGFIEQNSKRLQRLAPYASVRRRSVYELGFRFRWEADHARHVTATALKLFDATRPLHGMDETDRELLEYAALLHDIGYLISRQDHHKHALYLIKHGDLYGFSPEEIDVIANVARYHSGAVPKRSHPDYGRLPREVQQRIDRLAALLRIANGLDRSHFQNVTDFTLTLDHQRVHLGLRTRSDPQLEIWGALQNRDLFETTFNRRVEVE